MRLFLLFLACTGLGALVWAEQERGLWMPAAPAASGGPATPATAPPVERIAPPMRVPLQQYAGIAQRPVFYQTRRLPSAAPPPAPPVFTPPVEQVRRLDPTVLDRYLLSGVMIQEDDRIAILTAPPVPGQPPGTGLGVRIGDEVEGWRVEDITPQSIVFGGEGQSVVKPLSDVAKTSGGLR